MGRKEDRKACQKDRLKAAMKKYWWTLCMIGALGMILFGFWQVIGKNTNASEEAKREKKYQEAIKNKKDYSAITDLKNAYESILLATAEQAATTYDEVIAQLGTPTSEVDALFNGQMTTLATWTELPGGTEQAMITVNFFENTVIGKGVMGLTVSEHPKTTLATFEQLVLEETAYTYEQAIEDFGEPDHLSEFTDTSKHSLTATWKTNLEGDPTKNMSITFVNNQAVTKNQVGMQ